MTAPAPSAFPPHPGGPAAASPAKKSKAPAILMIIGGIILAISLIIGTVITVVGLRATIGGVGDIQVFSEGSGSITADEGDVIQLYAETDTAPPVCEVHAPGPDSVGQGTSQSSSTTLEGRSWSSFDSFTANDAGSYEIDCGGTPVAVGPPVSIGGIFGTVGGILLGIGGGFIGFVLLLIGLILWFLGRRRA